tara:strand:- start:29762 stop:30538 length:777 start_codon:yes stop_codon:yes gene_type:complete
VTIEESSSIAIIPARMDSTRLPGKPLMQINGLPMIQHCYLRAKLCSELKNVYVATCDEEIKASIESIGGEVILTSHKHERATTRTSEAYSILKDKQKINIDNIIMIQGDEPLILPEDISHLISSFKDNSVLIANLVTEFGSKEDFEDINNIKVVMNKSKNAMYFSRAAIPSSWKGFRKSSSFMQSGIIGFKRGILEKIIDLETSQLEEIESIDMNRALENNIDVKLIFTSSKLLGVDTQKDLLKAEKIMLEQQMPKYY